MAIKLSILDHQNDFLKAVRKTFDDVNIYEDKNIYANPLIDINDKNLRSNIKDLWQGYDNLEPIPKEWQIKENNNYIGLDIRMETGTGKTYCYTRMMYELNKMYGFHKFIIIVPTTSIREGSKSFLTADYAKRHFNDLYPNVSLNLSILEAQKNSGKKRKEFPFAVAEFTRGSSLQKNRFSVLLTTLGMINSKATMGKNDYDQTLLGSINRPYDALNYTRPVVIIDEPHKFKKGNVTFKNIIEEINPQCIVRFGATFPDKSKKQKDFNNLIFNLGPCQAFNNNLVKGVETYMIEEEKENDNKIKLIDFKQKPKVANFRDEKTKKTYELTVGDSLSIFGNDFSGVNIENIGKAEENDSKAGVILSNDKVVYKSDIVYGGAYSETYQELMLEQSIINHLEIEKENFLRTNKIKTLSLYFIDSVESYRDKEGKDGHLRLKFQELLEKYLNKEINKIKDASDEKLMDYKSYLEASLKDLRKTNGGYFCQDNSNSDDEIKNEVDQILREKETLLSFKDNQGNWNTRRFIFSKWTLKEGWDNPNVFQIVKMRSSGSEISKLQEVGRGLRLPVDENGNRISDEQFYLRYMYDFSEKDFVQKLKNEINSDNPTKITTIDPYLSKIAETRNISEEQALIDMLTRGYVDANKNIKEDRLEDLFNEYPEIDNTVKKNKIIDGNEKEKNTVAIKKDKFKTIEKLWEKINKKYYLKFDDIPDQEIYEALCQVLNSDIYYSGTRNVYRKRSESVDGEIVFKESPIDTLLVDDTISYKEFLTGLNKQLGIPFSIAHKALCNRYEEKGELEKNMFTKTVLENIVLEFNIWLDNMLIKRFSYKALNIKSKETSLTDYKGEVYDRLPQGVLGVYRDYNVEAPDKFIYDAIIYDSDKEHKNILKSDIDEVVVFGKIPRRSIRIPTFTGDTTSPDFMYVINSEDGDYEVNFIVETKDIKDKRSLRDLESLKIKSAEKFFETLKEDGLNVKFKKQMKQDDIVAMIKKISSNEDK